MDKTPKTDDKTPKIDDKTLQIGIAGAVGCQLANLVFRSPIGERMYDSNYGLEQFVNGATQVGAIAGVAVASYGLTKLAAEKGLPFTGEKTRVSAALTSAAAVGYGLAQTEVFYNAVCNMGLYNHEVARVLEPMINLGIGAGIVATGILFTKDVYDLASAKIKGVFSKK